MPKILGIETSCDETAASVVKDGKTVLSNIVASSLKDHQQYGGIIPEIASRRQIELINAVVQTALEKAQCRLRDIDAIAVTRSPGLIGSLLVGLSFARALGLGADKDVIEVDHIKAHLYANFLRSPSDKERLPRLPAIGLVVSGGHTSLYQVDNIENFKLLGTTRDDAAGEAFDKVARILNLGYPGGPVIDRLAKHGKNNSLKFSCARLEGSHDFSFSGVKTAVLNYHTKHSSSGTNTENIAYSFQDSVVSVLCKKSIEACLKRKCRTLLVGGGVAANSHLRTRLEHEGGKNKIAVHFPPIPLCIDNAAMIAGLGYSLWKSKNRPAVRMKK